MLESLSSEELQFIKAIEKYKQENGKLFLSWTEVLKILKDLGYRKMAKMAATEEPAKEPKKESAKAATTEKESAT